MMEAAFDLQPYLENDLLILRPLQEEDFENLYKIGSDPLIWEMHPAKDRYQESVFKIFFSDAILSKGAFAVIDKMTDEIIGSTRFHTISESKNAIEIGWTFLARKYWGGVYNKSMKCLMMGYAFNFVENIVFYIGENNIRSRKALVKLGGEQIVSLEGRPLLERSNASVIYKISKDVWSKNATDICN